jgi:hypothetical protein
MPSQDRVRCHNGGNLPQDSSAEWFALGRQSSSLVVGEAEAAPAGFELHFQDAVLFYQPTLFTHESRK